MKKFLTISVLFFLILSFVPASGSASLIIPLDTAFSEYGHGDPLYKADYGNVTIKNIEGTEHHVEFTIELNDTLGDGAYVSTFYFNTTEEFDDLTLPSSNPDATLNYDFNSEIKSYKADGAGSFDGFIDFGTAQAQTLTFVLSGTDLDETDFLAQSFGGDKGHFTIAAHIQGQGTDIGYVGGNPVPIPSTILLLGAGLVGLAGFRRKKQ